MKRCGSMLWLAAFGVAARMSGCVKMEEEFTIKPDGSGSISLKYSIAEQSISQIHAMRVLTTELAAVQPPQAGAAAVAPGGFEVRQAQFPQPFALLGPHGEPLIRRHQQQFELGLHAVLPAGQRGRFIAQPLLG